jgi:Penicillin binding protein transpeptidase domain
MPPRGRSDAAVPLTPTGFAPSSRRRGRHRARTISIVVVVALLVAGGTSYVLVGQAANRTKDRHARAAGVAYLAAWGALDQAGASEAAAEARLRQALAGGAQVGPVMTAITTSRDSLKITAARYTPGPLARKGAAATLPYSASVTLAGLAAPFTYNGTLNVAEVGGAWKVTPSVGSVYPGMTAGQYLGRTASTAARGRLLDVHGTPLSTDADLAGNLVGRIGPPSGLERVYDNRLTPSGGAVVLEAAGKVAAGKVAAGKTAAGKTAAGKVAAGRVVRTLRTYPMAAGADVTTTLDLAVQRAGEAAMAPVTQNAALVAIDTRTGGVLALVSHPSFGAARAVRNLYPPGSTFKIITTTAALMSGQSANQKLACTPTVTVDGRVFHNAESEQFGTIPLADAFAQSCNTAFINLEKTLPAGALQRAAQLYGFNAGQPLPIKSAGGSFPTPTDPVVSAAASIGQAQVQASPLQMASVAAAVASGTWRQPFVTGSTAPTSHALPAGVAATLRGFMRDVVTTGTAAVVHFPGVVYGKTGTAEFGTANPPQTHAWFVGFRGTVAFAVIVEDGGFGATTAAPAAARFLTALGPS